MAFGTRLDESAGETPFFEAESPRCLTPNSKRPKLTASDERYNRGVEALAAHAIPGLPIDADPHETHSDAQPLASCVEALVKRLGLGQSPWLERLRAEWPKLVGEELASSVVPGKWDPERKILYLHVKSATKLFEYRRTKQRELEAAVRAAAGDIVVRAVHLMQM